MSTSVNLQGNLLVRRASWLCSWLLVFTGATDVAMAQGIVFERTAVDLGRVKTGSNLRCVFAFQVLGSPVEIVELRPGCGCLRPQLDRRTYQPGERGQVVLGIHTLSQRPGPKRFLLTVEVRQPEPQTVRLAVNVELFSEITVRPSNVLVYLRGTGDLRQRIMISDRRPSSFAITEVRPSNELIQLHHIADPTASQGQIVHAVDLTIASGFPVGTSEEVIRLRTNDVEYPQLEIPVTVVKSGRYRSYPEKLHISPEQLSASQPLERRLRVRDQQGEPVRIAAVDCQTPGIRCTWDRAATRLPEVRVEMAAVLLASDAPKHLRIRLVEPQPVTLVVPIELR